MTQPIGAIKSKIVLTIKEFNKGIILDENNLYLFVSPDWVIRDCYTCKFDDKDRKINLDWGTIIPDLMNQPTQKFMDAEQKFSSRETMSSWITKLPLMYSAM